MGPFLGGRGGIERLTRTFASWVAGSGFTATLFAEHVDRSDGPYRIPSDPALAVFPARAWSRGIERADWTFAYVVPPGLPRRRWVPRLARLACPRVVLDLDPKGKFLSVTDLLHCEAPRDHALPRPHVVATPDPWPTIPPAPPAEAPPLDRYLTAFTPYGAVKGHDRIPAFLSDPSRHLVWCYDATTFRGRSARAAREVEANVRSLGHLPNLEIVSGPPPDRLYALFRSCRGYVCFSREEGLGWSMLDAVALGTPLAAGRVGVARALASFSPTTDFARPVFARYALPETSGFEAVARAVGA